MKICIKCSEVKNESEFYVSSKSVCKVCKLKYQKKLHEENKEEKSEYNKKYRAKNREHLANERKEWYEQNKEHFHEYHNQYRKERRKKDPLYAVMNDIRSRIRFELRKNKQSESSKKFLGCSIEELKKYLESKFHPGMTWENRGFWGWHIDHIRPIASFDLSKKEERLKCFHYTNLQPLWAIDNFRKNDKY